MGSKIATHKTAEERREEVEGLHDSITTQLDELTRGERWMQFLKLATGFHQYSVSNLLLIMAQRPGATRVAGFRQWQTRGRQVRKGEKAIRIFGYAVTKISADDDSDEDAARVWYPILNAFDISQTEPIEGVEPDIDMAPRLHGDDPTGIYDAVTEWLTHEGWAVVRGRLHGEDGRTSIGAGARVITIDDALEPAHAAVTILHEAGHALMHPDITDYHQHRGLYETEAESVAYVTAGAFGLDTARNSIGYIASWTHGDTTVMKLTADHVLGAVRRIIDAVDGEAQH